MSSIIATLALLTILAAAAVGDVRTRKIPNRLTVPAFGLALLLQGLDGWGAVATGLAGATLALVIGSLFVALGWLGAGDAKLLGVVGAFLGPGGLGWVLGYSSLLGGLFAILLLAHRRRLRAGFRSTGKLVRYTATGVARGASVTVPSSVAPTIPYAVPIALGTLLTVVLAAIS